MKYLEDVRIARLTSDLSGAFLNTLGSGYGSGAAGPSVGLAGVDGSRGMGGGENNGRHGGRSGCARASPVGVAGGSPYAYSPEGYSSSSSLLGGSEGGGGPPGSCRVVYGRVEAYTTKRTGSDKRTAHEVGERYVREMKRLNLAVEAYKRLRAEKEERRAERRRRRSRSVDLSAAQQPMPLPSVVYNEATGTIVVSDPDPLEAEEEEEVVVEEANEPWHGEKRGLSPLLGLAKPSNKRCRATSFDVSTGPSTFLRVPHRLSKSPPLLLAGTSWGSPFVDANGLFVGASIKEDPNAHPLIPQPSLYQSSFGDRRLGNPRGEADVPMVVPRRLVTDLVLTLNASFPDYDFGSSGCADFVSLPMSEAARRIGANLAEFAATTDGGRDFLPRFWNSIDDVLGGLGMCEVYSYAPSGGAGEDGDPLEFLTASMAGAANEDCADGGIVMGKEGMIGVEDHKTVSFSPANGGRIVSDASPSMILENPQEANLPRQISPSTRGDPPNVTLWSMNFFFVSRERKRIVFFACVQTMRSPRIKHGDEDAISDECDYIENYPIFHEARHEDETRGLFSSEGGAGPWSPFWRDEGVMVEDADLEEGADVDLDQDEDVFDGGAPGMSVAVPSQVV